MIKNKKIMLMIEIIVVISLAVVILVAYNRDIKGYEEELNVCYGYIENLGQIHVDSFMEWRKNPIPKTISKPINTTLLEDTTRAVQIITLNLSS